MGTQLAQISALVGFVLPLLIQFIQKEDWPNWLKSAVGIVGCMVAAIVTAASEGKLDAHDFVTSVTAIFVLTKVTYATVYKPAGLAQPKIKAKAVS